MLKDGNSYNVILTLACNCVRLKLSLRVYIMIIQLLTPNWNYDGPYTVDCTKIKLVRKVKCIVHSPWSSGQKTPVPVDSVSVDHHHQYQLIIGEDHNQLIEYQWIRFSTNSLRKGLWRLMKQSKFRNQRKSLHK
jgi:hypothetical protein